MRYWALAGVAVLAATAANCGDSIEPESLVGTWDATELRFTNLANASETTDIVDMGGSFTITLSANGAYQATITAPAMDPDVTSGTWAYTDLDGLTLTETGEIDGTDISVNLSGDTMTISSTDGITFDFGDGDVAVRLNGTLVRR
ncbi:MAG: hypothetical protein AMS20_14525 [Gemmatimonas sp. SG8_28]|jgi:hypothetical protein|nr:MAG: hypothetical protein AMS20_14525 [Gemmatimonas sp. SG8_28]